MDHATERALLSLILIPIFLFGVFIGNRTCNREQQLINELCNRKQYDFCEQVEVKKTYKMKEIGE